MPVPLLWILGKQPFLSCFCIENDVVCTLFGGGFSPCKEVSKIGEQIPQDGLSRERDPSGKVKQFIRQKDQTQFEIPYE